MKAHNIYSTIRPRKRSKEVFLSTFYVSVESKSMEKPIMFQVVFDCFSEDPIHLSIESHKPEPRKKFHKIQEALFGNKDYEWLQNIFEALDQLQGYPKTTKNIKMVNELKLLCILINLLALSL